MRIKPITNLSLIPPVQPVVRSASTGDRRGSFCANSRGGGCRKSKKNLKERRRPDSEQPASLTSYEPGTPSPACFANNQVATYRRGESMGKITSKQCYGCSLKVACMLSPEKCRDYWKEQKLLQGCVTQDGKQCIYDAYPHVYRPGFCTMVCTPARKYKGDICTKARYDIPEPEDHSDDICPTCGDPDCNRQSGHKA